MCLRGYEWRKWNEPQPQTIFTRAKTWFQARCFLAPTGFDRQNPGSQEEKALRRGSGRVGGDVSRIWGMAQQWEGMGRSMS